MATQITGAIVFEAPNAQKKGSNNPFKSNGEFGAINALTDLLAEKLLTMHRCITEQCCPLVFYLKLMPRAENATPFAI